MGFTHSWNGTILTITSDSGTSSADLQGPVGDTGPRGPQGVGGDGSGINLSDYYTKTEVDAAIADVAGTDTSNLATKEYVSSQIATAQLEGAGVDLSAYYTKSETDEAIANAAPTLTNYYTKSQVDSAIEEALAEFEVPATDSEEEVNLDGYYTKEEVDALITNTSSNYITTETLLDYNYITEPEVDAKIAIAQLEGAGVDMSGFYTKTEVDALISSSTGTTDLSNYYTKSEVDTAISTATENVDLSNYYTKTEIEALGHLTEAEVLALIQVNIPTYADGNEVSY